MTREQKIKFILDCSDKFSARKIDISGKGNKITKLKKGENITEKSLNYLYHNAQELIKNGNVQTEEPGEKKEDLREKKVLDFEIKPLPKIESNLQEQEKPNFEFVNAAKIDAKIIFNENHGFMKMPLLDSEKEIYLNQIQELRKELKIAQDELDYLRKRFKFFPSSRNLSEDIKTSDIIVSIEDRTKINFHKKVFGFYVREQIGYKSMNCITCSLYCQIPERDKTPEKYEEKLEKVFAFVEKSKNKKYQFVTQLSKKFKLGEMSEEETIANCKFQIAKYFKKYPERFFCYACDENTDVNDVLEIENIIKGME